MNELITCTDPTKYDIGKFGSSFFIVEAVQEDKDNKRMVLKVLQGEFGEFNGISKNKYYYSKQIAEDLANHIPIGTNMYMMHPDFDEGEEDHKQRLNFLTATVLEAWGQDGAAFCKVEFTGNPNTSWLYDTLVSTPTKVGVSIFADVYRSKSVESMHGQDCYVVHGWRGNLDSIDFVGKPSAGGEYVCVTEEELKTTYTKEAIMKIDEKVAFIKKVVEATIAKAKLAEGATITYSLPDMGWIADLAISVATDEFYGENEKRGIILDELSYALRDVGAHIHEEINKKIGESDMTDRERLDVLKTVKLSELEVISAPCVEEFRSKTSEESKKLKKHAEEVDSLKEKNTELEDQVKTKDDEIAKQAKVIKTHEAVTCKGYIEVALKDNDLKEGDVPSFVMESIEKLNKKEDIVKAVEEVAKMKGETPKVENSPSEEATENDVVPKKALEQQNGRTVVEFKDSDSLIANLSKVS